MSYMKYKSLALITFIFMLASCGGDSGNGQNPPQSSGCETGDLCIFEEALASTWTMSVYEQPADQLSFGASGSTPNSAWSIVDSGDTQHGKVVEVSLFQNTGYADFAFRPILANDLDSAGTQSVDLSSYVEDDLVFDFRIVNWEQNQIGLFLNMQCQWPCRSQFFPVANQSGTNFIAPPDFPLIAPEGEWQEARIPMHYLIRDNLSQADPWLDLTKVDVISIAPPFESIEAQRDVRYQIDNLRIEKSSAPQNSGEPAFNFFVFENSVVAGAAVSESAAPTVQFMGSIDEVNGEIYLVVDISEDTIVAAADVAIDESTQIGTVTLTLSEASNLGVGDYSQVVSIRACRDLGCNQEYRGSPQRVNVHYQVFE